MRFASAKEAVGAAVRAGAGADERLRAPGDLLARSDLCHLHEGRAEAEFCAIDDKLQCQDRDVVLVARSGSNQHVWVVRRSLSEIVNGRLRRRSDASSARLLTRATA